MLVDIGGEKGTIDQSEREMINNIFEFDNTIVTDIMTHRTDIVAIPRNAELEDVILLVKSEKYSRYPIYEDGIDNIVGVLHAKDLIKYVYSDDFNKESFKLDKIIRDPYFIPSSKMTDELFAELQKNKVHMAIIIDEYGGTAGIVTMEDLIEEIVGNIFDEYDEEEVYFVKQDNTYIVNELSIWIWWKIDVKLPVDEYETLSGFIIGQLGRIPEEGERFEIEFNDLIFKIEEVCDKRITKLKICKAY